VNRGTTGVNSLPKTVTRQRRGCDLNPGPSAPESSALTTRLPGHPFKSVTYWVPDSTTRTQTRTQTRTYHTGQSPPTCRGPARTQRTLSEMTTVWSGACLVEFGHNHVRNQGVRWVRSKPPPPWRRSGSLKILKEKLMPVSNHQNFYRLQFS